jgi:hypothetical protein
MEVYITSKLPLLDKITKVLQQGYLVIPSALNYIKSLIDYFEVPKDDNIQLVYNETSCGYNEVLYAPNFWLPTPASAARVLGYGYYMVDIDLGEMFLNFPLPFVLQ